MRSPRDEEPAVEDADDYKSNLPPLNYGPGLKVRIPPALMPDDDLALHYFDLYFAHAHPYVPVLDKETFYHQWHSSRETISPLILEAVFAIAGRLADEPAQGQQWMALATRRFSSRSGSSVLVEGADGRRTCRLVHGCPQTEHAASSAHHPQGKGTSTKKGLLLPLLDDHCSMRPDGQGSWAG